MVQQSFWTILCGNSDSLQDNLDFQSSGVLSIFNPYSCVNHALLISLNVLFIFVSLFLLFHKSFKTNFIARCHESRSCGSILCVSSVTFNCGLGLVYLGLGLWAVGKELITEKTMLPFHEWLVLLLQGTTWSLLSLTVSLKRGHLCATSMKVYLILAFSYAGFLFITSVLETVTNEAISVETVLDILSFPAGSILLFSFACSSRPCVVDGAQGTLYSPLQGHDAEANTGGENMDENVTPFAAASIFSKMTFWWMNPLMKQGKETTLEDQDIPKLRLTDRAETCYSVFWDMLYKRKQKGSSQRPPILSTLFLWQRKPLVISGFIALTKVLATSTGPFILKAFIEVAEGEDAFQYEAYALTACLFLVKCLESLSERRWYFSMRLIGLQIRSMLSVAIYQKQLRLSPAADITPGELVSYITVDAYRIGEFPYWFHQIWTTSLQMCLALLIIYYCVGMATVAAIIVVLLTVIGNMPLAKLQSKYQTGFMVEQDRMVQGVTEALENMKILKLYAWETHFIRIIERLRINEFKWLKAVLMQKGYYIVLFWSSPLFVPIATFTTCYFLGISLNASNVFTFLATIRLVQEPIRLVPDVVGAFIDAKVAIDRIMRFLEAPELERKGNIDVAKGDEQENGSIYVKASRISWETGPSTGPTLRNINLAVKPGEKVAICGEIGAGKTTLLSAILGEVPCVNGLVQMNGKLAYVSQNAWIQTGTIQENILFGSAMYPHRYKDTLAKCCLNKDLEMLPFGDETVIGERGVNLSGGQKQRVQLARALYQNADVYLLDDPFSAVDAHTATSLFNEYVMGALAGKTVLLVTHQVDFLPAFDSIVLMAGGEIIKAASYDELLASTEEFQGLVHAHDAAGTKQTSANNHSSDKTTKQEIQKIEMNEQLSMGDQLVKTEERDTGSNSLKPYIQYLKQDKGFLYFALSNFFHTCFVLGQFAQNYLLAANVQSTTGMGESAVIATYAMIGCGLVLVLVLRAWFIVLLGLGVSRVMFATLLRSLFRAPISFFDSTPLGRVLSRVSSDLSIVDLDIAIKMNVAMGSIIITYFSFIVLTVLAWEMIFIIIPMIYLIVVLQRHYSAVAKSLMRINGTTKSAVASHVAETAAGATTIRAFGEETKFLCKGLDLIDKNASPFFHMFAANEWFIQRLEIICVPVLSAAALLMTVLPHSSSSAGFIGMALSYGLTLNSSLTFGFQSQCQLENMLISVERLEQYMHIPSEAPEVVEDNRPHPNWPDVGKVEICNLKVRYRPNAPLVLQGISCVIEGGYKVGIVGRTGSGKTTLVGTLFRLVEPTEGRIVVDGLDISSIGLHDLRSHFGIIPQEATLFVGSVRYNFDPLSEYTDREIWEVLEKCQLKEAVQEKPEGLSSLVVQDGSNWSMGQRQLFCLGRALLKRPKILVLDEATASIDNSTDAIIQKTIRREFADHTVITVAHRIPTVMDCTKVLALCDGRLAEYDDPEKLINQEGSLFGQLVREYWSHTANGRSSNDSLN